MTDPQVVAEVLRQPDVFDKNTAMLHGVSEVGASYHFFKAPGRAIFFSVSLHSLFASHSLIQYVAIA